MPCVLGSTARAGLPLNASRPMRRPRLSSMTGPRRSRSVIEPRWVAEGARPPSTSGPVHQRERLRRSPAGFISWSAHWAKAFLQTEQPTLTPDLPRDISCFRLLLPKGTLFSEEGPEIRSVVVAEVRAMEGWEKTAPPTWPATCSTQRRRRSSRRRTGAAGLKQPQRPGNPRRWLRAQELTPPQPPPGG
jgi:hypothetical protein